MLNLVLIINVLTLLDYWTVCGKYLTQETNLLILIIDLF